MRRVCLIGVLAIISACGGSGQPTPPPSTPPVAFNLTFPSEASLTDSDQVTVVGAINTGQVTSVLIKNGQSDIVAMLDTDGRWRANAVPLQPGDNTLLAEVTTTDGRVTQHTIAIVRSSAILSNPSSVLYDPVNERVLVADARQLLSFDVATQALEVISSQQVGAGQDFTFGRHLALAADGAVLVQDLNRVLRVDSTTGDRSEYVTLPPESFPSSAIARDAQLDRLFTVGFVNTLHVADLAAIPPIVAVPVGEQPPFGLGPGSPIDATYVAATDTIYTVYRSTLDVVKIDGTTGESSSQLVGQGGTLSTTVGVDYDDVEDRVLVLGLTAAVYAIDPNSGMSSVLIPPTAAPATSGPIKSLSGLTHGEGNLWTVSPSDSELLRIELASGNQAVDVSSRVGGGAPPGAMLAGRYDPIANRFIAVTDLRIIAIDLSTGSRELLADLLVPVQSPPSPTSPPSFFLVSGMALSRDGTVAWITDPVTGSLGRVNLQNGDLQVISGPNVGAGPLPDQMAAIAVNPEETLAYVGDRFAGQIFRYDLVTGQRSVLFDLSTILGSIEVRSLELDANANRLIVNIGSFSPANEVAPAIYALDLLGSDLTLVADLSPVQPSFSAAPRISFPTTQMSLSEDGAHLLSPIDGNPDVPFAIINLAVGLITPLSTTVDGPPLFIPNAIDLAPDGRIFALDSTSALFMIDRQSSERVIVSK